MLQISVNYFSRSAITNFDTARNESQHFWLKEIYLEFISQLFPSKSKNEYDKNIQSILYENRVLNFIWPSSAKDRLSSS
jgi:hypothetical protein